MSNTLMADLFPAFESRLQESERHKHMKWDLGFTK